MGIFRSTTKSQFGEILEENSDLTVNTGFGNSSEIPCFLHLHAPLKYKLIEPPPPPPPGPGRVNIPVDEGTKIRIKGTVSAYCKCDNNGEWKDRFGRTQGTGKCDDEGWNDFLYTKTMKTKWDCEDAPKNEGIIGMENFCGGRTERKICKDFPLDDLFPDMDLGGTHDFDRDYVLFMVPMNTAARDKCKEYDGDETGWGKGYALPACGPDGKKTYNAAKDCGAEILNSSDPISGEKWSNAVVTQEVKDCMILDMSCGGDPDIQAGLLTQFLSDNFSQLGNTNDIFPAHDCETGDCMWSSSSCYDDEEDCKKKKK